MPNNCQPSRYGNTIWKRAVIMAGQLSFKCAVSTFLLVGGICLSTPASAGFQWVAPGDSISAPSATTAPQGIAPSVQSFGLPSPSANQSLPEVISPVVIMGEPERSVVPQIQPVPAPPVSPVSLAPTPPAAPVVPLSLAPAAPVTPQAQTLVPPADGGVVVGFAKSVPLAVALRQILPSGYAFSIDPNVDMGTLVSFRGGRPWRETLRDALSPVGLVMAEQGQMITVKYPPAILSAAPTEVTPPASSLPSFQPGMQPKNTATPGAVTPGMVTTGGAPVSPLPLILSDVPLPPAPTPEAHGFAGLSAAPVTEAWTAERGDRLRKVLEGWSRREKVELDWLSEYDYPLDASVSFTGSFEDAVRDLLVGFQGAHPQPVAELHSNQSLGQKVLIVQTRGNTNSD